MGTIAPIGCYVYRNYTQIHNELQAKEIEKRKQDALNMPKTCYFLLDMV